MSLLIKNAKIYDGSGGAPFMGMVLTEGERIIKVAQSITDAADEVLDLGGLSLAPGFIDAHSHNDWFAIKNQPLKYFDPFIRQGITTFVTGNCGLSATGFEEGNENVSLMGGGLFFYKDTTGVYGDMDSFFAAIDENNPCNIASLVGHCSARAAVAGYENRKLTEEEQQRMLNILEDALKKGAAGISLGLMYEPGLYADTDELKKVAELCIKHNKPLTVHPRANSKVSMSYPELLGRSHLLRAVDELVEIAKGTRLKLHYSHAIFVGRSSFGDKDELLSIIARLRENGVDAIFDIYDETMGVSVITVILPAWYQSMTAEQKKKPLTRLKLAALVKASSLLLGFGFKDIVVAYIGEGYEHYEGKTVHEIAKAEGMSDLKAYLMLCEKSGFKGRVNMGPYSTPEIISELSRHEHSLYMTDAWVEEKGVQNPAIYDCFPKFLRDAVTGSGPELAEAVRKMSGAAADRFMLEGRGYLREGGFADMVVFDEAKLAAAKPDKQTSFGIERVFINGRQVLNGESLDEAALKTSGKAIRV